MEESALYTAFEKVAKSLGHSLEGIIDPHRIADEAVEAIKKGRDRNGYTGSAGGRARADKLSPERRREIAMMGAIARHHG